ncbi:MAG: energy transducer TonB, partial [Bacteroidales bacterium]
RTQEIIKYVPPEIVDTIVPVEKAPMTADEAQLNRDQEIPELSGSGFGSDILAGTNGMGNDEPFFQVEVMPTFRGGDFSKFADWVGKRTNYPEAAIKKKIRGTVYLTFVVEKDGTVTNVTVVRGVDPLLDNEAVKAVAESPKWSPGLQRGQPVRVRFLIPLSFLY